MENNIRCYINISNLAFKIKAGKLQGWLSPFWELGMSTMYDRICMVYKFPKNQERYRVKTE